MNQSFLCLVEPLTVHPLLEAVPRISLDSPEMLGLISSIELRGVLSPLLVNDRNEVMDGRCRLYAAIKAGLKEIPCIILPDEDAPALILETLCLRRHLTKSALAYLAFPLMEAGRDTRLRRRTANLKAGRNPRMGLIPHSAESTELLTERLGFDRKMFYAAREVHGRFAKEPAFKAQMEPELLSGEVSLQGVLAAWNGIQNKDKPRFTPHQFELFDKTWDRLDHHFQRTWKSMDDESRAALKARTAESMEKMPYELQRAAFEALKAALKAPQPPV